MNENFFKLSNVLTLSSEKFTRFLITHKSHVSIQETIHYPMTKRDFITHIKKLAYLFFSDFDNKIFEKIPNGKKVNGFVLDFDGEKIVKFDVILKGKGFCDERVLLLYDHKNYMNLFFK